MSTAPQLRPDIEARLKTLCALDDLSSRRSYLAIEQDLISPEVVDHLAEIVRKRVQVDIEEGSRAAEAALLIATILGDATSRGIALRATANVSRLKGQCREAVVLLKDAVLLFENAGRDDEIGRTLSTSIQPLILLGRYDEALACVARARRIFKREHDGLRLARLDLNAGNIFHRQERFSKALVRYESAYEQLLPHADTEGIAVALHNLAVCLISLNDFDRALQTYDRALEFFRAHNLPRLAVQADYNVAYLYYLRGEYEIAIERLRTTRENARRQADAYHAALCDLDLSDVYVELNLSQDAAEFARQAAEQFEQLAMGYENARSLINLAAAHNQMNQRGRAMAAILKAHDIFLRENHQAGLAYVQLYLAILRQHDGDSAGAVSSCRAARQFFESAGLDRKTAVCDLVLAQTEIDQDQPEGALRYLVEAENRLKSVTAPSLNFQIQLMFGRLHEAAGESSHSFRRYERARKELEKVTSGLYCEDLKIAFMKNKLDVYERLIQWCLRSGGRHAADKAFQYMEQAKCRVLVESILGRAQPFAARMIQDGESGARIRDLRGRLNWLYHRIDQEELQRDEFSVNRIQQLWNETRGLEKALVRLLQELPGIVKPHPTLPGISAVGLHDIRAALPANSTLIEYYEVDGQMVAAVVTRENLNIVPLSSTDAVKEESRLLRCQFFKFHACASRSEKMIASLARSTERHLRKLHSLLFEPLSGLLRGDHLVIVPHGCLHSVPFHALFDGHEYVIDRFATSYAPSASVYALCQARPSVEAGDSLVLGVPDSKAPWILHEAENVAKVVKNPKLLLGQEASQDALNSWGPRSRRIHVATHGVFRADNPLFSSVRLGDSYLSLYDLYRLHLPVDLFTLSGCATGLNVVGAGDELVGLARGLLYAGANSLLLSLWNVHDQSTAEFMQAFYSELETENITKARAFQSAAAQTRRRYPHPYHWAAFVLMGRAPK